MCNCTFVAFLLTHAGHSELEEDEGEEEDEAEQHDTRGIQVLYLGVKTHGQDDQTHGEYKHDHREQDRNLKRTDRRTDDCK